MLLDLTPGIIETSQYNAWKFPGGEIHFKLKPEAITALLEDDEPLDIQAYINSSDGLIFLLLVANTIFEDYDVKARIYIPYMAYQQADRHFSEGECFSLRTVTNMLNTIPCQSFQVFDPHSDVTPALLKNCTVIPNDSFINGVIEDLVTKYEVDETQLVILSPDAGAYKKIFSLCQRINFRGSIENANKYRKTDSGDLHVRISLDDFDGRPVLIVDDICMGGRTFTELSEELMERNSGLLFLAVSHGIFGYTDDTIEGILYKLGQKFKQIFTTNSVRKQPEFAELSTFTIL